MLLVDWISVEISSVVHMLANTPESSSWVKEVSQRADLSELNSFDPDGSSMPSMNVEEVKAMLHSAAQGHRAGRDFARDAIRWRHERGHSSDDAALLIDLLLNARNTIPNWQYGAFPLEAFDWMWKLIVQYVLPNPEHFGSIVRAFACLLKFTRKLDEECCLQIRSAFACLLRSGVKFHQHDAASDVDLKAAFDIGLNGGKLLRFTSIEQSMPNFLPNFLSEVLPTLKESMAEWIITALFQAFRNLFWSFLPTAALASFSEGLQMKCIAMAPSSFLRDLSKLDVLHCGPRDLARRRLATKAGKLDMDVLDFVRGKRKMCTAASGASDRETVEKKRCKREKPLAEEENRSL